MTVAGSRVKHLPGVRVIPRKRKLMWAWGAVLGVLAFAMVVGGVWTWHASGRRTREDRADVVLRPRMERVSGGDAAQSPRPTAPRAEGGAGTSRAESSQAEPSRAKADLPSSPGPAREVPAPPSARGVQQRPGAPSIPFPKKPLAEAGRFGVSPHVAHLVHVFIRSPNDM